MTKTLVASLLIGDLALIAILVMMAIQTFRRP